MNISGGTTSQISLLKPMMLDMNLMQMDFKTVTRSQMYQESETSSSYYYKQWLKKWYLASFRLKLKQFYSQKRFLIKFEENYLEFGWLFEFEVN